MQNILGNELKPLKFQEKIIKKIQNKNALVCLPTGAGKTLLAYNWSDLENLTYRKVIFTAPIKALSNEKFCELNKQGFNVGLVTGDVKYNIHAPILCLTQEIYAQGYYNEIADVVIDEIHYIFHNSDRARCYMDSISKTNPKSKLLFLSATCHDPTRLAKFLGEITNRKIIVAESNERLVNLKYNNKGIKIDKIKDAIVFCFSRRAIGILVSELIKYRSKISKFKIKEIQELALKYNVEYLSEWDYGISRYHGKLLPKEKMMIEYLYRNNYLDVIVGTDALALGVNLPAKCVVMAQLVKPTGKIVEKSEFLQLSGRAGRYGYHDEGIATYLINSPVENKQYDTKEIFDYLVETKLEQNKIKVDIDYKGMLNGRYKEDEAEIMSKFTYPYPKNYKNTYNKHLELTKEAEKEILDYFATVDSAFKSHMMIMFKNYLNLYYLPEWDLEKNVNVAKYLTEIVEDTGCIDVMNIITMFVDFDSLSKGEILQELLLFYKYFNHILSDDDNLYTVKDYNNLRDLINDLDYTVFNPQFRIENSEN